MMNEVNSERDANFLKTVAALVRLTWQRDRLSSFYPLLLHGVKLPARAGTTVRSVLSGQFRMSNQSLCRRARAIFLDGKTVGQPDPAELKQGSTPALSAVLTEPFLLHAYGDTETRVQRPCEIPDPSAEEAPSITHGFFTLKLFNLRLDELGPSILKTGVWAGERLFGNFLTGRPKRFWEELETAQVNDRCVDSEVLRALPWSQGSRIIGLTVQEAR